MDIAVVQGVFSDQKFLFLDGKLTNIWPLKKIICLQPDHQRHQVLVRRFDRRRRVRFQVFRRGCRRRRWL